MYNLSANSLSYQIYFNFYIYFPDDLFSVTGNFGCCNAVGRHKQTYLVFRLRDISEELLTVIAEVLLSELTFLRLVDTVSRGDNTVSYVTSAYIHLVWIPLLLHILSLTEV
jgi:hypothetical protein